MPPRPQPQTPLEAPAQDAAAGLFATVPMTAAMLAIQRLLPDDQQTKLEPRQITDALLRRAGLDERLSEQQRKLITLAAHFGYGMAAASGYRLAERILPVPRGWRGPAYGLMVWAASYAGHLPALDILPPPQRRPLGRNLLLLAAHVVWGAALEESSRELR